MESGVKGIEPSFGLNVHKHRRVFDGSGCALIGGPLLESVLAGLRTAEEGFIRNSPTSLLALIDRYGVHHSGSGIIPVGSGNLSVHISIAVKFPSSAPPRNRTLI